MVADSLCDRSSWPFCEVVGTGACCGCVAAGAGCLKRSAMVFRAVGLAPTSGAHEELDEAAAGAGGPGALEKATLATSSAWHQHTQPSHTLRLQAPSSTMPMKHNAPLRWCIQHWSRLLVFQLGDRAIF
jgi:hypothetical protein